MDNHSHISNIPSHTQLPFLEQLSDREFWDYAQSLANQKHAPPASGEEALECQTEQGRYLLPLRALREIVAPPHKLTFLPQCPSWMLGITAWRGHIIPVVDLASYFSVHKTSELVQNQETFLGMSHTGGGSGVGHTGEVGYTGEASSPLRNGVGCPDVCALANSMLLVLDGANSLVGIQIAVVGSIITLEQTRLTLPEQAPSWYPRCLLTTLLGVYNGSVILNPPVLIAEIIQHIEVSGAYE